MKSASYLLDVLHHDGSTLHWTHVAACLSFASKVSIADTAADVGLSTESADNGLSSVHVPNKPSKKESQGEESDSDGPFDDVIGIRYAS